MVFVKYSVRIFAFNCLCFYFISVMIPIHFIKPLLLLGDKNVYYDRHKDEYVKHAKILHY